ncbi:MAG: cold-shock protein [Gammaproteobacteria bacterium]|nr:MAG: cold-shock protein [Gammaproteobacteria bacterium]
MKTSLLPILCLINGLAFSYWQGHTPALIATIYFVMSLLCYYLYSKDKKAARNRTWRVSEKTLHLTALLGGWPGSIIAQTRLRHKTQKTSFRIVFWLTLLLNISFLIWLHTPQGSKILHGPIYKAEYWTSNPFGSTIGFR